RDYLHARQPEHHPGPDPRRTSQHTVRRDANAEQCEQDDRDAQQEGHHDHGGIGNERAHGHEKWSKPSSGATRAPCSEACTSGAPDSTRPMRVSGSASAHANAAASRVAGAATSSSYSSPPRAAVMGSRPARTGSASRSITSRTPLAAATWRASANRPSEMSIAA